MTKQELAAKIWSIADELRKNIKASEYKDYILGFMFYKYLCDKEMDLLREEDCAEEDLEDIDEYNITRYKDRLGYFINHEDLFSVWKKKGIGLGAKDVTDALEHFYLNLNNKYKPVFNKVFSALESGLSKLGDNAGSRDKAVRDIVDLIAYIPPTSRNYDVLGYIYEYLIQQFSSEAKKDGAFYTPHELTSLMSRIIAERLKGRDEVCCYDPCVGSGGLLLNVGKEVGRYISSDNIKYYGQEYISETYNLAKMNLFMQGVPVQNINMRNADTLEEDWPYFDEQTSYYPLYVDAVLSNPPYSLHWQPEKHVTDERFRRYGLAPSGKADYAFLLHCLYHIKNDGVMAIVLPHGVLFRGDSEGDIRKNLILNHNIETIISLPSQLFFSTGIPVIIMILSKERKADDILFIDASQSYKKDKKQNVLTESDVQRIFDAVMLRKSIPNYAHLASIEEIKSNDYNLNVPRYVSAAVDEAPYDLYSVMSGRVSDEELKRFDDIWSKFPKLKEKLLTNTEGYKEFKSVDCKEVISSDGDAAKFLDDFNAVTDGFGEYLTKALINRSPAPRIHEEIKDELFKVYTDQPLIDVYSVFQAFTDNWATVDTDLARLKAEGFDICTETEPNMVTKKDSKTKKTVEEQRGWKGKIIPFDLVKDRFFPSDYEELSKLNARIDALISEYTELWDNLDEDARASVCKESDETKFEEKKLKEAIKAGELDKDVLSDMEAILKAVASEKELNKKAKAMIKTQEDKAKERIESLSVDEVNELLKSKWIEPILSAIKDVGVSVLARFAADFDALERKYSHPLDELSADIEKTSAELRESLGKLTGSDADMAAVKMLLEEL